MAAFRAAGVRGERLPAVIAAIPRAAFLPPERASRACQKQGGRLTRDRSLTGAHFVPLYGQHGYALDQAPAEP